MRKMMCAAIIAAMTAATAFAGGPPPMYVVVDKVETTQCKGSLSSIRIWGAFTRLENERGEKYARPIRGYIEFGYGSDADAPKWQKAAGTGKVVAVGSCHDAGAFLTAPIHIGRPSEKDNRVDTPYPKDKLERWGSLYADGDLLKQPEVKALLAFANVAAVDHSSMSKFISTSVLDGLKEDGAPREFAMQLSRNPDYVGKCSLCAPTREAFVRYSQLEKQPEGKGLKEDLRVRLASANAEIRHAALRELVQKYMERGYAKANMSPEERTAMRNKIDEERKRSMGGLPRGQTFCPACDGASCALAR